MQDSLTPHTAAVIAPPPSVPDHALIAYATAALRNAAPMTPPSAEVFVFTGLNIDEAERQLIQRALQRTNGNRTAAATLLGMHARTLRRKLRAMNGRASVSGED